jgi:hypothetical protein
MDESFCWHLYRYAYYLYRDEQVFQARAGSRGRPKVCAIQSEAVKYAAIAGGHGRHRPERAAVLHITERGCGAKAWAARSSGC